MVKKPMRIVNIVATSNLKNKIDLVKLAETLPNTEYNPDQFPGLVLRVPEPKCSILVFSTGKIVCTGLKSISDIRKAIDRLIKDLAKIKVKIKIKPRIKVQNMVASGKLGVDLNLSSLVMKLKNVEYEPEQFPGLVYRILDPNVNFLIFSNGELVCTGVKNKKMLEISVDHLIKDLRKNKLIKNI